MEFSFTFAAMLETAATLYLYHQFTKARQRKAHMLQALRTWVKMGNTAEVHAR